MDDLFRRASEARANGLPAEHPEVHQIVADWISLYSGALHMPVTPEFLKRFAHHAEQAAQEPSSLLWDIMRRLDPEKSGPDQDAQRLLPEGLRRRLG